MTLYQICLNGSTLLNKMAARANLSSGERSRAIMASCSIIVQFSELIARQSIFFFLISVQNYISVYSPVWSTVKVKYTHFCSHVIEYVLFKLQPASVAQLDAPSDWRPGGRGFDPRRGRQHSFVEIDHEIFSTVILSLPLIQEGQLSVSGERMCTILVNGLED